MSLRRPLAIALASSVALAGLVTVAATGASGAPPTNVQPRAAVTNTSVLTTVKTFVTDGAATGVAVNAVDDTIYVSAGTFVYTINGVTGGTVSQLNLSAPVTDVAVNQVDDTVYAPVADSTPTLRELSGSTGFQVRQASLVGTGLPYQVAVNQVDDTVYVTYQSTAGAQPASLNVFRGANLSLTTLALRNASSPRGVAVNDQDDTVYVALSADDSLSRINGVTDDSQTTLVGDAPWGVGVHQADDTVYVMNNTSGTLSVINGATGAVSRTVPLSASTSTTPTGVAVDQLDDTVYATATSGNFLWILNGSNLDDSTSIKMRSEPRDVAVDDTVGTGRGLVYVATGLGLEVVARATPVLNGSTTTGAAGATVTVDVTSSPTLGYGFDANMVNSLRFNDSVTALASPGPGAGQWSAVLPSGLPTGPVTVEAVFSSSNKALAGTYTVQATPTPTPTPTPTQPAQPQPPGAPGPVLAQAGDRSAEVTWGAPSFSGSGPVTEYEAEAFPGGNICRSTPPMTSCKVTGLSNGSGYLFRVRAKNYVGWGSWSEYSNMVTPKGAASIVITGSRDSKKPKVIKVSGTTTGLTGSVTPWLRLGAGPFKVEPPVRLTSSGTFRWSAKTSAAAQVYVTQGSVKSNTVTIRAR